MGVRATNKRWRANSTESPGQGEESPTSRGPHRLRDMFQVTGLLNCREKALNGDARKHLQRKERWIQGGNNDLLLRQK